MIGAEAMIQLVKNAVAVVDTVVDAIKAKTDTIPTDPAETSDITAIKQKATSPAWDQDTDSLEAISEAVAAVGPQFSKYSYSGALAASALYKPADKTIVMTAHLVASAKLEIRCVSSGTGGIIATATAYGFVGAVYCDGTDTGFQNTDAGSQTLTLYGLTMA